MTEPWHERLKIWWCKHFGHKLYGEVLLDGSQWCRRCGRTGRAV